MWFDVCQDRTIPWVFGDVFTKAACMSWICCYWHIKHSQYGKSALVIKHSINGALLLLCLVKIWL